MISAVKWAREQSVPFLGICLGFQVAVVEWARNVCGLENANSAELEPETPHPVICFMPEISKTHMGGTMRLGLRPTMFEPNTEHTKLRKLYGSKDVAWERHRHRYEVEPKYVDELESKGNMRFIGKDERGERMQMLELDSEYKDAGQAACENVESDAQTTRTLLPCKRTQSSALDLLTLLLLSSVSSRPLVAVRCCRNRSNATKRNTRRLTPNQPRSFPRQKE
jgi:CTP synthase (UTP-ammonia lyase)